MKKLAGPKRLPPVGPLLSITVFLTFCAEIDSAPAQRAPANARIEVVQLRENFYVIGGAGGNIVV